ncbi:MAG TPA: LysM peptidoglycan-binding domain-containing protein [Thermomicrobiales bacterium]|nr:LysM peptidoglycan-binding domain-containing protein [Thermomicrobiales bacterium]
MPEGGQRHDGDEAAAGSPRGAAVLDAGGAAATPGATGAPPAGGWRGLVVSGPAPARRGARPPRLPRLLARLLPHLLVLGTALAVVAGGGFWNPAPRAILGPHDTGVSADLSVPNARPPAAPPPATGATAAGSGYFTRPPLPVTAFPLQITQYDTAQGETIADIAARYHLKPATLLWANNLQDPEKPLPAGTKLRVPPIDGMLHTVQNTDTLDAIAAKYQVDVAAITAYQPNHVEGPADLVPGQVLLVPGGTMPTRQQVETYTVRSGDTLWSIADRYGLNPSTIVWANDLTNADMLQIGQALAIPPVNGVLHKVQQGETLDGLARKYSVKKQDIVAFAPNGLGGNADVRPGQDVMIPGGTPPAPPPPPPPAPAAPAPPAAAPAAAPPPAPAASHAASGTFRWPVTGTLTTYFGDNPAFYGPGGHNGIDIANAMWTPVVAADSGVVIFAGWHGGLGNAVGIDHQNGFQTWYGHAVQLAVSPGQWVNKGQVISYIGSTGLSTGPHLHFIIMHNGVYVDPLGYLPR